MIPRDFKLPDLTKIMKFSTGFLESITMKARISHLDIIRNKWTSPDGRKFPKLSTKYANQKQKKYGNKNPNLYASGLMFSQIIPKKPKRSGHSSNIKLSYGVKDGAKHPRNSGDQIDTAELLTFHAEATPPNKFRPITGKAGSSGFSASKAIHNDTQDIIIKDLVNQITKNIEGALRPYSSKIDL